MNRKGLKYISIQLDENELKKRRLVKVSKKLSDRKIYMAMLNALLPGVFNAEPASITPEPTGTEPEPPPEIVEQSTPEIVEEE